MAQKNIKTGWSAVAAVAMKNGLVLSDPKQFLKAKELTLPVAKRPLTSNPFAILAKKAA